MILRTLQLENFGLYAGATSLDLAPRTKRGRRAPIVLIGGKNGAGKTTILEAVRLALYGKRALGVSVSQTEYDSYLRNKIHRSPNAALTPQGAAVGLEFDFAELGIRHHYRVRRSWQSRGKSITEELVVEEDGQLLTEVRRADWQIFLQDLIPPGVSQLFFFDGEKIQQLAEGEDDQHYLASAVRSLLGLDLVGRLRDDLALYLARKSANGKSKPAAVLAKITKELAENEQKVSTLTEELGEARSGRSALARKAEQIRAQLISKGGTFADIEALKREREIAKTEIAALEDETRDLANDLLPFAIMPALVERFSSWLDDQRDAFDRRSVATQLLLDIEEWQKTTSGDGLKANWTSAHLEDLDEFLSDWALQGGDSQASIPSTDIRQFREVLQQAVHRVSPRASHIAEQLDRLIVRREELDRVIARDDVSGADAHLNDLRELDHQIGLVDANIERLQHKLSEARVAAKRIDQERGRFERELRDATHSDRRLSLAGGAARALEDYQTEITIRRVRQLEDEFVACFNQLAHKGDLIASVKIDAETLQVHLSDQMGKELRKSELSAGEKQIYAISMLWALARTSGRPLPMIIDTPLARLDDDHRTNLLERYFPVVSHQVVMLSTDTEVDERYFHALRPKISHAIYLRYDGDQKRTVPENGYFWQTDNTKSEHALQQA